MDLFQLRSGHCAESPQRNPGSCDRRIGMGVDAPNCRHSQSGTGWSGCSMRSAQYRRPDHCHKRHQPCGAPSIHLSDLHQSMNSIMISQF